MKSIVNLLFEARILKGIPRSGFNFLGSGSESVADHCFMATFIGYVLSNVVPEADALRLIQMCLIHDLTEARTGDLNYVQKKYLTVDESRAIKDLLEDSEGAVRKGKNGQILVNEKFSWENIANSTIEIFKSGSSFCSIYKFTSLSFQFIIECFKINFLIFYIHYNFQ